MDFKYLETDTLFPWYKSTDGTDGTQEFLDLEEFLDLI